jgi:hypothetical protein
LPKYVRFRSLDLGIRKFLFFSEKEFKNGNKGTLNRNKFVNAKQSESTEKCSLQMIVWAGSRSSPELYILRPQKFIKVCTHRYGQSWKTG